MPAEMLSPLPTKPFLATLAHGELYSGWPPVLARAVRSVGVGLLVAQAAACLQPRDPDLDAATSEVLDVGSDVARDSGAVDVVAAQSWERCRDLVDGRTYPTSIQDVLDHINVLPRPVTLPCFLHSLTGRLGLNATDSPFSLQAADGASHPRVFLMHPDLIMSVTLAEEGRELLEFGEMQDDGLTVKGELAFPIERPLGPSAPFRRIRFDGQFSGCASCHALEREAGLVEGVMRFASQPLRTADHALLDMDAVAGLQVDCDRAADPGRCDLLDSLFRDGDWEEVGFPRHFATIFR